MNRFIKHWFWHCHEASPHCKDCKSLYEYLVIVCFGKNASTHDNEYYRRDLVTEEIKVAHLVVYFVEKLVAYPKYKDKLERLARHPNKKAGIVLEKYCSYKSSN